MTEFIGFLARRFEANHIDPKAQFFGKRCLDAGCGNGRGALFMAEHGAASVDCIDISASNVRTTTRNLSARGYACDSVIQGTLETLPYPDESFDFVWCNGVLMHTANPDVCLEEISRVLKPGGKCWLYVYGADGLPWYWVSRARAVFGEISIEQCREALQLMRLDARYIAEYVDDWTVPYLRTFSMEAFSKRLLDAGFSGTEPLRFGVGYDTSHRRNLFPEDAVWMGDGDLRFLLTKTGSMVESTVRLSANPESVGKPFDPIIIERFAPLFDEYERAVGKSVLLAVVTSATIQRTLRDILDREGRFALDEFYDTTARTIALARQFQ